MTTALLFRPLLLIIGLPIVWLIARCILQLVPRGKLYDLLTFRLW